MRSISSRAGWSALTLAVLALGACSDNSSPTGPTNQPSNYLRIVGDTGDGSGGTPDPTPALNGLSVSTTRVVINGAATGFTATFDGSPSYPNLSLQGSIIQGSAWRNVVSQGVWCNWTGCSYSGTFAASNPGSGSGTLVAGAATFRLQLIDQWGTVVGTRNVAVTLVLQELSSLTLASNVIAIGGSSVPYTATVTNPAGTLSDVVLQAFITQGTTWRAASGTMIWCGAGTGVLPAGGCTSSFVVGTNNTTASGWGTLVPGTATLEMQLIINGVIEDRKFLTVTLTNP